MTKHIIAIALIFICTTVAWSVLGTTIFSRTYSFDESLKGAGDVDLGRAARAKAAQGDDLPRKSRRRWK
jgi:hypothetical protein